MDWIEIIVKTTTEGADMVAQAFYEVGVTGVVVEDPIDIELAQLEECTWDYIDDSILANMSEDVLVKAYISNDASFTDKYAFIKERIEQLGRQSYGLEMGTLEINISTLNEEDWSNNWKQYYKPIKVSERLVIKPSWEPLPALEADELVLEMDPGMAFGTGTHETTTLCIEAIDRYIQKGAEVADIGCGTGVLGISAILLGAEKATAVDVDSNAVRITAENARRNHVEDSLEVIHGNLLDPIQGQYDMVIANIIADVIIQLTDTISDYLKPNGLFITSGIIQDRLTDVVGAMKTAGLEIIETKTKGEWAMVVCKLNA
ncbi:MAG: 50S ribosomal protein L11 methyltransferase [Clostridiales bacterium]|nr:50S ribosomal protein L11 methyltransferase [Clostridiales bacterium]